jgi:hypothetical protein
MHPTNPRWLPACLLVSLSPCLLVFGVGAELPAKVWTEEEWTRAVERLRPGMTPEQVREALGPPRRIGRQILYQRYLEQWVYDSPRPLRLEFDCRRGQLPSLLPLAPAGPPTPRDGVPPAGKSSAR